MRFNKQISILLTAVMTAASISGLTLTASASPINNGVEDGMRVGSVGAGVTADYAAGVLTLSGTGTVTCTSGVMGAALTGSARDLIIQLADGADIILQGIDKGEYSYGLYQYGGSVTVKGNGTLTVNAAAGTKESVGICTYNGTNGSLYITDGATVVANGSGATGKGVNLYHSSYSNSNIKLSNSGKLIAKGEAGAIDVSPVGVEGYTTAKASTSVDGTNPVDFAAENLAAYKYVELQAGSEIKSGIYVGSKMLTGDGLTFGDVAASYDDETKAITLSGKGTIASTLINIEGVNTQGAGIFTANEGTLTINLAEGADITVEGRSHANYSESYTVYAPNADIKITGKGKLTVIAPESLSSDQARQSNAIQTGKSVIISEATVNAVGLETAGGYGSRGIAAAAVSVENNGKLLTRGATRAIHMADTATLTYYDGAVITASNNYDGTNPVEFVNEYSSNIKKYKYIRVMPAEAPSGVYVASEQITSMGLIRGGVSAAYDTDTQTLGLSGTGTIASTLINIEGVNTQGAGIFTANEGTLTINLAEGADITVEGRSHANYSEAYTVYAPNADIKITGKGKLTVIAPESLSSDQARQSNAIQTGKSLTISEAIVNAVGLEEAGGYGSRGVSAAAVSVENNGGLLAKGATRAIQMANDSTISYYEEAEITASENYTGTKPVEFVNEYSSNIKNYKYIRIMPPYAGDPYENLGEQIIFHKDTQLDLAGEPHPEKLYKLFIGWSDADGNAVSNNITYKAGTVLNAEYIDYNANGETDFAVTGAQFRTEDGDIPEGLRFIADVSSRIRTELNPSEYGAVAIPLELAGIDEPELGKKFTYNGKEYSTGSVSAERIFAQDDNGFKYTMCITNLEGKYTRQYAVRGYMKYNDINGISKIIYTDQFGANAYASVKTELADEAITDERSAALTSALEKMETERAAAKAAYMSQPSVDVIGTSADKRNWIYQLENGIMVREAEIDSGKGGDPVEIVQITDIHFNYCNDKDFIENNKQVMDSWNSNGWLMYGASFPNALACMKYASYADKTIVTGDTISYLSWGNIDLMNKAIWQQAPEALIAIGNHEPRRAISGSSADDANESELYSLLQSQWKHDLYYTSEVLNDKVMVVVMDNQKWKFRGVEYDLLAADIALAREKGIPMLIFEHVAIPTKNPAESAVEAIRVGDTSKTVYNFYEGDAYLLKYGKGDEASDKVYDLIVNNADVIKGIFCGDLHEDMYTEVKAKTASGEDAVIPQYILNGAAYDKGHALKITVK